MISSNELRAKFLQFFKDRGHEMVTSSSLVPANDKTLLFTNAGMVQFKDVFLGLESRSYTRATTSQRCVRAGGKHNDLENVGYTARHHTFFEMLGNFSFGDYFKEDAIVFAWEFLTRVLQLPEERLWVTVYQEDDEAADIWLNKMGVPEDRLTRKGKKDNFWQMGDTGPCGPCSEIFYDHGPDVAGGPPGSADEEGDRYVEIWNLVFMQFNRAADGTMTALPKPSVDTGMGLERLAAVLQGVHSNYEIDLFSNLVQAAARETHCRDLKDSSLRVIADHIRSCAFLIVDGVLPSNEGRGYVLRRIIRRAVRHGHKLGQKSAFFNKLVDALVAEMGQAYPDLIKSQDHIRRVLLGEEERFAETLEQGMTILEAAISDLKGPQIPGDVAFKLYDTYGFPIDLTADIARERQLNVDIAGFDVEMEKQRALAKSNNKFKIDMSAQAKIDQKSEFTGYEHLQQVSFVTVLVKDGQIVERLNQGDKGVVVLQKTAFYAESGGQVGDRGNLLTSNGRFEVSDTQKQGDAILHVGVMREGSLAIKDNVNAEVASELRHATIRNHTATHLMHAALRKVLGDHVQQKGSLVNEHNLRFDFSHFEAMTAEQVNEVEQIVNQEIRINHAAIARSMSMQAALETGAMALFGEKYGEEVRVLSIGEFSVELCGGTHVNRAGDIGLFKITSEGGVAAGVRRIEAITGRGALMYVSNLEQSVASIAAKLKSSKDEVHNKVSALLERNRSLEKELSQLQSKLARASSDDILASAVDVDGLKVLAARMDGLDNKAMRDMLDQLKNKLGAAAVVLACAEGEKVRLIAGVSKDQTGRIQAGKLVNSVAQQVGGKGGGRPDMAQAGGDNPAALDQALKSVVDWVRQNIS